MAFYGKYALLAFGAAVAVSSTAGAQSSDWANRITVNGDARFRIQRDLNLCPSTSATYGCSATDNMYERMRFRLGVNAKVNDSLNAVARLSTGNNQFGTNFNLGTTPTSTAAAPAGWGARQLFTLDQAYLNYKLGDSATIQAGKVPVPFWVAGNAWTLWNFDQSLEGVQAKWNGDMGAMKPYATLNYSSFLDRTQTQNAAPSVTTGNGPDLMFLGAQLGVKYTTDMLWANVAIGSYNFGTKDTLVSSSGTTAKGNSTNTTTTIAGCTAGLCYANDYKETDVQAEVGYNLGFAPVAVYGGYTTNSDGNNKTAMVGGVKLGALKDVGSWSAGYEYRDLGADSFLATYGDPTWGVGGGTGVNGSSVTAAYQMWPNASLGVSYQAGRRDLAAGGNTGVESYYTELVASF